MEFEGVPGPITLMVGWVALPLVTVLISIALYPSLSPLGLVWFAGLGWWSVPGVTILTIGTYILVSSWRILRQSLSRKISSEEHLPGLVQTGPYRFSRNPMYLGGALDWAGWSLLTVSAWFLIIALAIYLGVFVLGVPHEERKLEVAYGVDYIRYKRRVGRVLSISQLR